ncbi:exodeoxyribonuclease III [candidate division WS5 bacterium]|uniref:Exodeoxyribonuclease III n=1 Tax=candidate division WS5 bacterium TaxID=2093353 RepID=A0A419DED5_9BACT|nr:MAG: exodeoxyribonuclease III [candidate division WS5 bacterium]
MKIISWNVNGIRSAIKQGFFEFVEKEKADIYLLQEVKISESDLESVMVPKGYYMYSFLPEKKGYAGLIVYSKQKPLKVTKGIEIELFDIEARVVVLEFKDFFLINSYFPHSHRELKRLKFKMEFNDVFSEYIKTLSKDKPVIIGGDFNVAHKARDLANPKSNKKNAGFTVEERNWFDGFLKSGYTDTFRMFEEGNGHYTWWSNRPTVRERNVGWRIDYFIVSNSMKNKVVSSKILSDVYGSDHCPIELEISV